MHRPTASALTITATIALLATGAEALPEGACELEFDRAFALRDERRNALVAARQAEKDVEEIVAKSSGPRIIELEDISGKSDDDLRNIFTQKEENFLAGQAESALRLEAAESAFARSVALLREIGDKENDAWFELVQCLRDTP